MVQMLDEPTGRGSAACRDALGQALIRSEGRVSHGTRNNRSAAGDAANFAHGPRSVHR